MTEKILITGVAGFLGTNLALRLLREGHHVTGIDNFYTGRRDNLSVLEKQSNFKFIAHDVQQEFPDIACDRLYHLACPASPPQYQRDPIATTMINVLGMKHALDLATKYNSTLLQASTSEVYGDPEQHPQTEEYRGAVNPIGIRACYDEGKRVAETLCMDYHRQKGTKIKLMRIFNTYGPYMDPKDGRVVSNLICQALRGEAFTLYGDGQQTRSFCYVDDLIDGMIRLMHSPSDLVTPVNIGNPDEFTVAQLADQIELILQSKIERVYEPLPADDPKQRKPDISKAKALLNWTPQIKLEQGLRMTIPWFKDQI
jgi:UDP-glucuronate decarboxylase